MFANEDLRKKCYRIIQETGQVKIHPFHWYPTKIYFLVVNNCPLGHILLIILSLQMRNVFKLYFKFKPQNLKPFFQNNFVRHVATKMANKKREKHFWFQLSLILVVTLYRMICFPIWTGQSDHELLPFDFSKNNAAMKI